MAPVNPAGMALDDLGGHAEEEALYHRVVEMFGPQDWTRDLARFRSVLSSHLLRDHGRYFNARADGSYELTSLGRTKARIDQRVLRAIDLPRA
jgi:hypothetical protein